MLRQRKAFCVKFQLKTYLKNGEIKMIDETDSSLIIRAF